MTYLIPGQTSRSRAAWVTARLPHHIYRCYDADGLLLYIGCTSDVDRRMAAHRQGGKRNSGASRWLAVCMDRYEVDADAYPNRASGQEAESRAIMAELPVFNMQWASRRSGGYAVQCRIAHYLVDHGHLELAVSTVCSCWREVRESGAYMDTCVAHTALPGDLPLYDWDAAEAEAERELRELDAAAAAVVFGGTFKGGAA